jgi:cyclic beta-1,2-glucan synthetase
VFVIPSGYPSQSWPLEDSKRTIVKRLTESEVILESVRQDLADASRLDHAPTAAAEWILDNSYLFRAHIAEVRRDLPRAYAKHLPLGQSDLRIFELAKELAARTDFAIDAARIVAYLNEWQKQASLKIAELWFFPLMLRTALVEGLAQLALRVNQAQQLRELAYLWANRFAVHMRQDAESFAHLREILEQEPYAGEPDFATSLAEQLQGEEAALVPLQQWIEQRFGTPVGELVQREHAKEAAIRLSTVNAFGSFRALNSIDFGAIFESVSIVESILRTDPSGIYAQSDFTTRDRCRRVVERLSRCSKFDEAEVARQAVAFAARSTDQREGCVPYYLVAEGMPELESSLATHVPVLTRLHRSIQRHSTPLYLGSVAILTACMLALTLSLAHETGVNRLSSLLLLGGLALFPLSELAIQILNALVVSVFLPGTLAKMDFRRGIPDSDATLVVVPMMLSSLETCRREIEKLEVRFLANRESNLFFSLFGDYVDHSEPDHPQDAELLQALRSGIEDLNTRYPQSHFALFHRPRDWSASEQSWIGRERKRGKLEDLNAYLLGEHPSGHLRRWEYSAQGALCDYPRLRYTIASRHSAAHGGNHRAPFESRGDRRRRAERDAGGTR